MIKRNSRIQGMSTFSQVSFFDFSSTASCHGSPIIIQSTGGGCNSAIENNSNSRTCSTFSGSPEYIVYSSSCADNLFDFSEYTRNYVVKTTYSQSDKFMGVPLQGVALAADSACHSNPGGNNSTKFVKANCNGGQPILQECMDSLCKQCKTYTYTNEPCQLLSAGASVKVECIFGKITGNTGKSGNATIDIIKPLNDTSIDVTNPFSNKSYRKKIVTIYTLNLLSISIYSIMIL